MDGIADDAAARAWLDALAPRLPAGGSAARPRPGAAELAQLRDAVRAALHDAVTGAPTGQETLDILNAASTRAPRSPVVARRPGAGLVTATDHHGASRADVVLAALAADAIDLLTGPRRSELRTCGAPGCVLMFLRDHPRREWCSNACGNRARQARHYERKRRRGPSVTDGPAA